MGNRQASLEEVVVQGQSPGANIRGNINRRLPSGQTLLSAEIQLNNVELVKYLMKSGADTNITDRNGEIPLNVAIRSKNAELVAAVLENLNTNVNKLGRFALAPIHVAAITADAQIMQLVLEAGADPGMIYRAYNQGYQRPENSPMPLEMAIEHADIVKLLLQHGASVNTRNPLLKALQKPSTSVASLIVEQNSLDIKQLQESPYDILAAAARIHNCDLVRRLVQKGLCVQRIQSSDKSEFKREVCALAYVIHCNCRDCFEFLFPYVTNVNAADMNGYTLLEYALNSSLWSCGTGRNDPNRHKYCMKIAEMSANQGKNVRITNEWMYYTKHLLAHGADLSVVWNKLTWSKNRRNSQNVVNEREAMKFCLGAYHCSQNFHCQTYFRNLGISGDLENMALVYLDGYTPTEEDIVVIENQVQSLSIVKEIEDTAFVKGKLHLMLEQTRTLKNIAVVAIRRSLGPNIYKPGLDLPLPDQLRNLVLLQDIIDLLPAV